VTCFHPVRFAHHHLVGHEHVIEKYLVEALAAIHERNRPHRDAGRFQLDDELRQSFVAIAAVGSGAAEHEERVRPVRPARPYFLPGDAPTAGDTLGTRSDRCQVGAGVRFAHAQRKGTFAARDGGQKSFLEMVRTVAQQTRSDLPVTEPVCGARRGSGEHLLGDYEAFEIRTFLPAVALRPGHADPAVRGHPACELRVEFRVAEVRRERTGRDFGPEKRAHLLAQFQGWWR
jgi:hypothetical protein